MRKLALILMYLTAITVSAQQNLIKNGDFEKEFTYWNGTAATISPYEKKTGNASCIINQFVGSEWKGIEQIISIPKNTYALEVSAWVKGSAIDKGKEDYNAGVVTLEFLTTGETNISYVNVAQLTGTTPWTLYKELVVIPEKAGKVKMILALAQTSGSILFDAVKVIPISKEAYQETNKKSQIKLETISETSEQIAFLNGNFEKGLKHWIGYGKATPYKAKEGRYNAILHLKESKWADISQKADIPVGTKQIKFSGWLKADNIVQGENVWNNGLYIVEFTKEGSVKTIDDQIIGNVTGTKDWTFFEKTLTIPEGTKKYRILIALNNCIGTLFADDIQVEMLSE
ncbi:hypothetical protein [Thalassobellus citreus]|uniref:hypothetical protein n=1 Tax=Thalassobellus citreus TaxID=3367752 RepID=UPI0037BCF19B